MLAEEYHYTPQQIGEMTWYQVKTLTSEKSKLGTGTYTVTLDEWKRMKAERKRKQDEEQAG